MTQTFLTHIYSAEKRAELHQLGDDARQIYQAASTEFKAMQAQNPTATMDASLTVRHRMMMLARDLHRLHFERDQYFKTIGDEERRNKAAEGEAKALKSIESTIDRIVREDGEKVPQISEFLNRLHSSGLVSSLLSEAETNLSSEINHQTSPDYLEKLAFPPQFVQETGVSETIQNTGSSGVSEQPSTPKGFALPSLDIKPLPEFPSLADALSVQSSKPLSNGHMDGHSNGLNHGLVHGAACTHAEAQSPDLIDEIAALINAETAEKPVPMPQNHQAYTPAPAATPALLPQTAASLDALINALNTSSDADDSYTFEEAPTFNHDDIIEELARLMGSSDTQTNYAYTRADLLSGTPAHPADINHEFYDALVADQGDIIAQIDPLIDDAIALIEQDPNIAHHPAHVRSMAYGLSEQTQARHTELANMDGRDQTFIDAHYNVSKNGIIALLELADLAEQNQQAVNMAALRKEMTRIHAAHLVVEDYIALANDLEAAPAASAKPAATKDETEISAQQQVLIDETHSVLNAYGKPTHPQIVNLATSLIMDVKSPHDVITPLLKTLGTPYNLRMDQADLVHAFASFVDTVATESLSETDTSISERNIKASLGTLKQKSMRTRLADMREKDNFVTEPLNTDAIDFNLMAEALGVDTGEIAETSAETLNVTQDTQTQSDGPFAMPALPDNIQAIKPDLPYDPINDTESLDLFLLQTFLQDKKIPDAANVANDMLDIIGDNEDFLEGLRNALSSQKLTAAHKQAQTDIARLAKSYIDTAADKDSDTWLRSNRSQITSIAAFGKMAKAKQTTTNTAAIKTPGNIVQNSFEQTHAEFLSFVQTNKANTLGELDALNDAFRNPELAKITAQDYSAAAITDLGLFYTDYTAQLKAAPATTLETLPQTRQKMSFALSETMYEMSVHLNDAERAYTAVRKNVLGDAHPELLILDHQRSIMQTISDGLDAFKTRQTQYLNTLAHEVLNRELDLTDVSKYFNGQPSDRRAHHVTTYIDTLSKLDNFAAIHDEVIHVAKGDATNRSTKAQVNGLIRAIITKTNAQLSNNAKGEKGANKQIVTRIAKLSAALENHEKVNVSRADQHLDSRNAAIILKDITANHVAASTTSNTFDGRNLTYAGVSAMTIGANALRQPGNLALLESYDQFQQANPDLPAPVAKGQPIKPGGLATVIGNVGNSKFGKWGIKTAKAAGRKWPTLITGLGTGFLLKGALVSSLAALGPAAPVVATIAIGAFVGAQIGYHYDERLNKIDAKATQDAADGKSPRTWLHRRAQELGAVLGASTEIIKHPLRTITSPLAATGSVLASAILGTKVSDYHRRILTHALLGGALAWAGAGLHDMIFGGAEAAETVADSAPTTADVPTETVSDTPAAATAPVRMDPVTDPANPEMSWDNLQSMMTAPENAGTDAITADTTSADAASQATDTVAEQDGTAIETAPETASEASIPAAAANMDPITDPFNAEASWENLQAMVAEQANSDNLSTDVPANAAAETATQPEAVTPQETIVPQEAAAETTATEAETASETTPDATTEATAETTAQTTIETAPETAAPAVVEPATETPVAEETAAQETADDELEVASEISVSLDAPDVLAFVQGENMANAISYLQSSLADGSIPASAQATIEKAINGALSGNLTDATSLMDFVSEGGITGRNFVDIQGMAPRPDLVLDAKKELIARFAQSADPNHVWNVQHTQKFLPDVEARVAGMPKPKVF